MLIRINHVCEFMFIILARSSPSARPVQPFENDSEHFIRRPTPVNASESKVTLPPQIHLLIHLVFPDSNSIFQVQQLFLSAGRTLQSNKSARKNANVCSDINDYRLASKRC
ncbi:unnamed protein product [Amoebophrya sp. A25]|nr:unnamed protein product [Amoebophrya sp. A25]|eukprot:GSA25T00013834001.1